MALNKQEVKDNLTVYHQMCYDVQRFGISDSENPEAYSPQANHSGKPTETPPDALERRGIPKGQHVKLFIDIMRHAHAESIPGMEQSLNLYRPLSAKGIAQAIATRARYSGETSKIKLVIHSPAPRALCTAAIAIGDANPVFSRLDTLWVQPDEEDGAVLWKAFDDYGYDLEKYFTDPVALEALGRFGRRTDANIRCLLQDTEMRDGDIVIVAGHAVFCNFTASYLAGLQDADILHIPFGEAARMRLTFEGIRYVGYKYNP